MMRKRKVKHGVMAAVLAVVTAIAAFPVSAVDSLDVISTPDSLEINQYVSASSSVSITKSVGYSEGAYVEWAPVSGADGYNVYCDGVQLDSMLVRQYPSNFRADAVGLKAGSHTLKVVPVNGGKEISGSAEATVSVKAHDRTGFSFDGTDGSSGAYNADGTLKSDAVVLYITEDTKDTVSMDVVTSSKGTATSAVGLQDILTAYKKGYETRPLDVRIIGTLTNPSVLIQGDLTIDGGSKVSCGMTIEGIGNDATISGFGIRFKNISNVEVRNLGIMLVDSDERDCITLQQGNDHVWVHNCDFFYGMPGSDSDQKKGDGSLDCKLSTYVTFSYNHFWDSGKCNLLGLSENTTEDLYITYHHNWYDHSDSRHPRVRFYTTHVYNNYFDGNSKYGIGATRGCSIFAENNYFRNCKYPMLISMQGSDVAYGAGTFSSEDGGIIKAYGNYIEGQKAYTPYQQDSEEFDAYEVSSRDEIIPSSVKTKTGPFKEGKGDGDNTYNNFDTSSKMYSYTPDKAEDVPSVVMANAGRLEGGDFKWTFNNAVDDESYDVNEELKAALINYKSSIVAIGSGFTSGSEQPVTTTTTTKPAVTTTTTPKTTTVPKVTTTVKPIEGALYCAPGAKGSGTMNDPMDVYEAVKKVASGQTIYLLEGTYELSEMLLIDNSNNGAAGAYKTMSAYPGAKVVFDFSGQGAADGSKRGVTLDGSYWKFYGFEITKAADNGMLLSGNNNIIEMMVFNDNQDTGLQISRYRTSAATIAEWPTNNLILNCTSKNNCDNATMENADGFAAKLTCGEGNVFDGCMAYNNSDDGWDLFAKPETGPTGVVTIQNSIAFRNGFTEFGEGYGDCDGNGFKLGGSGVGSPHVIKNSLAFENLNCGFTDNNNPKLGAVIDCTAINNGGGGKGKPNFSCYRCTDPGCDFDNLMSYYNTSVYLSDSKLALKIANDKYVGTYANGVYYNSGYYKVDADTAVTNGGKIGTKYDGPAASDFISMAKAPAQGTDFHTSWRNADGSLNPCGLYETKTDGTYATMGYHMYNGTNPGPVVTTTTTTNKVETTTTIKTTTSSTPTPSGAKIHNFTENGTSNTFYTITGNLAKNKGTVNYNGLTLTQCLKMESATSIGFTNTAKGNLTLVFVEPAATVNVDGTKYTANGDGIITVSLDAGTHSVTKADTANLFYMVYADGSSSSTTTSVTTTKPVNTTTTSVNPDILYGDVNVDGKINLTDVIYLNKCIAGSYTPSPQGILNAACDQSNSDIDLDDTLALLKYLIKVVELPVK